MQIGVQTYEGRGGVEMLGRFHLDGHEIEVSDNLDRWHGADYRYFKMRDEEGNIYVLRLDESKANWDLIMFQSEEWQTLAAHLHAHSSYEFEEGV